MKKIIFAALLCISLPIGAIKAEPIRDVRDLELVRDHVREAIHEMEEAQARNHYDMGGHADRVIQQLRDAEHELREGIEYARRHR